MLEQDGPEERNSNKKPRASKPIHDMVMELKKRTKDLQEKGHDLSQDDLDDIFDLVECSLEWRWYSNTYDVFDNLVDALREPLLPEVAEIVNSSEYLSGMMKKIHWQKSNTNGIIRYNYTIDDPNYKKLFPVSECRISRFKNGTTAVIKEDGGEYTAFSDIAGSKAYENAWHFTLRQPTAWQRFCATLRGLKPVSLDNENDWIDVQK